MATFCNVFVFCVSLTDSFTQSIHPSVFSINKYLQRNWNSQISSILCLFYFFLFLFRFASYCVVHLIFMCNCKLYHERTAFAVHKSQFQLFNWNQLQWNLQQYRSSHFMCASNATQWWWWINAFLSLTYVSVRLSVCSYFRSDNAKRLQSTWLRIDYIQR